MHIRYPRTAALFVCFHLLFSPLFAQEAFKLKWGDVAAEDLAMTTYTPDPEAPAVVLDERASLRVEPTISTIQTFLEIHRRVKILRPAGLDYADLEISYAEDDNVSGLRAQVLNPDGSSTVLKRKDFFKEDREGGYRVLKAALPGAQVGSVIELQYTFVTESVAIPPRWDFQEAIPVRRSLLVYRFPKGLDYIYLWRGIEQLRPTNAAQTHWSGPGGAKLYKLDDYFLMTDLPGLTEEPYISTMSDYRASVSFQLSAYLVNGIRTPYIGSWEKLAKDLLEDDNFGHQFTEKFRYNALLRDALPSLETAPTPADKVAAAYRFVANNLRDANEEQLFARRNLDECYRDGEANTTERSLMLVALLREAGLPADPVLLSTRRHGKPFPYYPVLRQFDRVIVRTELDGQPLLLDVTARTGRPAGLLRRSSLNGQGWLLREAPRWIDLPTPAQKETVVVNCQLSTDGDLSGDLLARFTGYTAQRFMAVEQEDKTRSRWTELLTAYAEDLEIDSLTLTDEISAHGRLQTELDFHVARPGSGERLYLSPVVYSDLRENPFALEERLYPIDIATPFFDKYIYTLEVPAGYEVEELPESVKLNLPDGAGKFTYIIDARDGKIKLTCLTQLKRTYWTPEEYATIRNFFRLVAEKQGEQIVLKKV